MRIDIKQRYPEINVHKEDEVVMDERNTFVWFFRDGRVAAILRVDQGIFIKPTPLEIEVFMKPEYRPVNVSMEIEEV